MTGGRIVLTDDERAIATRHLGFTISPHEECGGGGGGADRRAARRRGVVLTLGPAEAEEQLRDAMAIGADRGDPPRRPTARSGTRRRPPRRSSMRSRADGDGFDLILFGNESADAGNYQVGNPGRVRASGGRW